MCQTAGESHHPAVFLQPQKHGSNHDRYGYMNSTVFCHTGQQRLAGKKVVVDSFGGSVGCRTDLSTSEAAHRQRATNINFMPTLS